MKQFIAAGMAWVLALGMIGCQVASAPTDATDEALLAVTTEATEPEVTRFVSTSRYQATLPPEPTVPETEPTEAAAEEEDTYYGDTSSDDSSSGSTNSSGGGEAAPAATEAPTPQATEAPTPTETEPPTTAAPAVSLDYSAAASYGNSYMASTYGCIVDYDVDGYYPADITSLEYYINNGGQAALNAAVARCVDLTYYDVGCITFYGGCSVYESNGNVYIIVYYG